MIDKFKMLFRLAIVLSIAMMTFMAAEAGELSPDVARLQSAKVFTWGDILGQATKNELHASYKRICTNWTKLADGELDAMMNNGTPAGKLFSAALTWETNCFRGRPTQMNVGFEKLKNDKTKVNYRSGCVVSEHTVGEIASAFLQKGEFQDFRLSRWCEKPVK